MKNLLLLIILIIIIILLNNNVKEKFTKYGYQCIDCPWEGSVRDGNSFDVIDCKCPVGTYNKTTVWGPYGVYVPSGHLYFERLPEKGECKECPRNTYKDNTDYSLECTRCPFGKKTSDTGQQDISSCKCPPGKSGPDGNFECKSCPDGQYKSVIGDSECTPVPDNAKVWNPGTITCISGYHKNLQNIPNTCDENVCNCSNGPNTTGTDCPRHGVSYCNSCNAGYELINDKCIQCTSNKYKSTTDNTRCLDKPKNSDIIASPEGENIGFTCISSPPCLVEGCVLPQYYFHEPTNECVLYNYLTYHLEGGNQLANIDENGGNSITISGKTRYQLTTTNLDYYVNNVNYGNEIYWSIKQELIFGGEFNIKFFIGAEDTRELVKLVEFDVDTTSPYYSIKRFIVHQRRTKSLGYSSIEYNTKMEIKLVRTFRYQYLEIRVKQIDFLHEYLDTAGIWGFEYFDGTINTYILDDENFFKQLGSGGLDGDCVVFRTSLQGRGEGEIVEWESGSIWQIYKGYYLNI